MITDLHHFEVFNHFYFCVFFQLWRVIFHVGKRVTWVFFQNCWSTIRAASKIKKKPCDHNGTLSNGSSENRAKYDLYATLAGALLLINRFFHVNLFWLKGYTITVDMNFLKKCWDSLLARLKSHYKAWGYKRNKLKRLQHTGNLFRKNLQLEDGC